MQKEKIFVNGLYSKPVHENAPDFIKGKLSVNIKTFYEWMRLNKGLADEKGYINMTVLEGRKGRYIEVDTWKPEQKNNGELSAQEVEKQSVREIEVPPMNVDLSDIPF